MAVLKKSVGKYRFIGDRTNFVWSNKKKKIVVAPRWEDKQKLLRSRWVVRGAGKTRLKVFNTDEEALRFAYRRMREHIKRKNSTSSFPMTGEIFR